MVSLLNVLQRAHAQVAHHLLEQPITLTDNSGDWKNLSGTDPSIPPCNFRPLILFLPFWGHALEAVIVLPQTRLGSIRSVSLASPSRSAPRPLPAETPDSFSSAVVWELHPGRRPGSRHPPPRASRDGARPQEPRSCPPPGGARGASARLLAARRNIRGAARLRLRSASASASHGPDCCGRAPWRAPGEVRGGRLAEAEGEVIPLASPGCRGPRAGDGPGAWRLPLGDLGRFPRRPAEEAPLGPGWG